METLPGNSLSRTADGGMGYTDAYGNTIRPYEPDEKISRRKTKSSSKKNQDKLPYVDNSPPVWTFK